MGKATFRKSDAWILLSVIYACKYQGNTNLSRIIAVADFIHDCIVAYPELDGALVRLTEAGYIMKAGNTYAVTPPTQDQYRKIIKPGLGLFAELREIESLLGVSDHPENPGSGEGQIITMEEYEEALKQYLKEKERLQV